MRISDWSSDVCSSDLMGDLTTLSFYATPDFDEQKVVQASHEVRVGGEGLRLGASYTYAWTRPDLTGLPNKSSTQIVSLFGSYPLRSEEHTSELQSLMSISSVVFCLKKIRHHTH